MIDIRSAQLVAQREVREQVRGRPLWVSTVIAMIAVALLVILPHVLASGRPTYHVAVVAASAQMRADIVKAADAAGATVVVEQVPDRAAAENALQHKGSGHADIAVVAAGAGSVLVDRQLPPNSTERKALVAYAIAHAVGVDEAIQASGIPEQTARALTNAQPAPIQHLRPAPIDSARKTVALAGAILFFMLVLRYGIGLLMGVVQEKSTRVIEVILSAVRPVELLTGKIAGSALMVLLQAGLLVVTAFVSAVAVGSNVLSGKGAGEVLLAFAWVVVGFLLYSALFAAAGALASKVEDAQSVSLPLQIPLFIGYFASFSALGSGSANGFVKVLAYVPFTAPMDMPILAAVGGAGPFQVGLSLLLTAATIVVAMRVAAVVFSRSILRTGQRLKVRAVLRERRPSRDDALV